MRHAPLLSLVPRRSKKGLVHTACACATFSVYRESVARFFNLATNRQIKNPPNIANCVTRMQSVSVVAKCKTHSVDGFAKSPNFPAIWYVL